MDCMSRRMVVTREAESLVWGWTFVKNLVMQQYARMEEGASNGSSRGDGVALKARGWVIHLEGCGLAGCLDQIQGLEADAYVVLLVWDLFAMSY